ncbi:MAG: PAS domain-containing protein [Gemmatimonadetes bacterium]|nr:PAS domain-containing protein [Gemmatimonadota bacterium]
MILPPSVGLWNWDLRAGRVVFSHRWKALLGYTEAEVGDLPDEWLGRVHPEDRRALQAAIMAHGEGHTESLQHVHRLLHRDGTYRWVLSRGVAARDEFGRACRLAGSLSAVTRRQGRASTAGASALT